MKSPGKNWIRDSDQNRWLCVGLLLLVVLGLAVRLAPLQRYVTPDEPAWVERSVRFADALAARDWAAIPSTGHPGVTTMWLGAAGVTVRRWLNPVESAGHLDWIRRLAWLAPENGEAFRHLSFFLPYGRIAVALISSLSLLAVYSMARHLFGRSAAYVAVGLLAFDPFLVGHSGLLHTDGLLSTFSTLSVLSLLMTMKNGRRANLWSLVSGGTAGLALLTKSLGAYLVIFAGLVLVLSWLLGRIAFLQALRWAVLWALALAVLYVGLYPAMWRSPLDTVRGLLAAPSYQSTTALMPTFFAGRTALRHGPEFYAVALPFRLSPLVLIGLLWGAWMLIAGETRHGDWLWLGLFSFGYVLPLALSAKRYQRYLLPAAVPLTIVAAVALEKGFGSKPRGRGLRPFFLVLLQLLLLLPFAAHPLTGLNALLGGPWVGRRLLSVDWGEGMGAAARWLNRRTDAGDLTVAASSVPSFAAVFTGRTVPLEQAAEADYVVRDVPQSPTSAFAQPVAYTATLGGLDHAVILTNTGPIEQASYLADHAAADDLILVDAHTPLLRRYSGQGELLSVASLADEQAVAEYLESKIADHDAVWRVASPAASPITAAHLSRRLQAWGRPVITTTVGGAYVARYAIGSGGSDEPVSPRRASYGGRLSLIGGLAPPSATRNDDLPIILRWQVLVQAAVDFRARVTLRDGTGHTWATAESLIRNEADFPTSAWSAGVWADVRYELTPPPGLPPGRYTVEVSVYDASTGARLGATDASGAFRGTRVPLGEVRITPGDQPADLARINVSQRLKIGAGSLTLLGINPPVDRILSGDSLSFSLVWQADAAVRVDHRVRFRLVDSDGQTEHEVIHPLSMYPTSRWRVGDWFRSRYSFQVPTSLSRGTYRLTLNVLDEGRIPLWEEEQNLAQVDVAPQDRSFELAQQPFHQLDCTFGDDIHLLGYDLPETETRAGQFVPLTLYWRADGPTDQPYTLFVHLRDPDGRLRGQVDRTPGGGAVPTTRWAAGQVIVEEIELPVAADAQPGYHRIVVGFYDPTYGDRLPVADASGERLPDREAVLPTRVTVAGD